MHPFSKFLDNWIGKLLLLLALLFFASIAAFIFTRQYYWLAVPFAAVFAIIPIFNLKLFYRIFLLSIPLSVTVFMLDRTLSTSIPIEPIMALLLGISILLIINNPEMVPKWFISHSLTFIIFLQFVWLFISVLYAYDHLPAVKFLVAKMWFLASCFLFPVFIFKEKRDFRIAFKLVVIPILIHAVIVFGLHAYFKFGYFESNQVVIPFYKNHVDYGSMMSMILPLIGCAYYETKGNKKVRRWLVAAFIFTLIAVYASYSRGAILAVIFSFVIFIAIKLRAVNFVMPAFFLFIGSMVFYLAKDNRFMDFTPNKSQNATQDTFFDTVMGAFTGEDMSSMERFYRWIATMRMSSEHPIVGVGPNNWYDHYKPYAVTSFRTWVSRNEEKSTTHNYFLLMLSEQGYPAMILYGLLIIVLFAQGQRTYRRFKDKDYKRYTLALTMLIAAVFVNNFFSEFLETHKIGGLFYISIAILIILDRKSREMVSINKIIT